MRPAPPKRRARLRMRLLVAGMGVDEEMVWMKK
jgi:hypothetical protein